MYVSSEDRYMHVIPQHCVANNITVPSIPEDETFDTTATLLSRPVCSYSLCNSMPSAWKPAQDRSVLERSPHPYARHREQVHQDDSSVSVHITIASALDSQSDTHTWDESDRRRSHAASSATSSGTEADDERPHLLKALPPAVSRPRKGLKLSDGTATPLLTPSQLDRDGRALVQGYFDPKNSTRRNQSPKEGDVHAARQLFEKRKRAERIRRLCEGALLAAIGITVMSGPFVYRSLWNWHRGEHHPPHTIYSYTHTAQVELLGQVAAVLLLIAVYPLRVVSSDLEKGHLKIWTRFRVPASFDPASVLYPTFIPVLVALSLLPQYPALLLPNLILGLASLPPRLFPAGSRLQEINTLHWMVSIIPLIVSENTELPSKRFPPMPYSLKGPDHPFLNPEALATLYPLHQLLLVPLHYLTTTSLLPAEKHLLSTSLINLLCFAVSPQASILRALLWVGGVWMLVLCTPVLQWIVALARVPRWRFRRAGSRTRDRKSFRGKRRGFFPALKAMYSPFQTIQDSDSDTEDEIGHAAPLKPTTIPTLRKIISSVDTDDAHEPRSAVERRQNAVFDLSNKSELPLKRRHTIAGADGIPSLFVDDAGASSKRKRKRLRTWYLDLTADEAMIKKNLYAAYIYAAIIFIIALPVRATVSSRALQAAEPIFWAFDYLFEGIFMAYTSHATIQDAAVGYVQDLREQILRHLWKDDFSFPEFRMSVGPANTRLTIIAYWLAVLSVGIVTVLHLTPVIEVDTRRKVFHAIMVTMLLPSTFVDPCFCALALSLVLAVFLLLEAIRAGQVPPLGTAIGRFVAPYVDGRDLKGPMVVSHVFLLIGCAIPLWLSLAALGRDAAGWDTLNGVREVAMVSGVVCVGMGDAAASLIGRRYGRHKWSWIGGKSLEGSGAFALAVCAGLMASKLWLHVGGWPEADRNFGLTAAWWATQLAKTLLCGCGASFMEAVLTGANDNVVVPVALWLLVRGVGL